MHRAAEENESWISSKEIIEKAGISRATLNNYIRLGIVPRPLVRKPQEEGSSAKKLGYFNPSVLDRLDWIKAQKKEGVPMEKIVIMAKRDARPDPETTGSDLPAPSSGGSVVIDEMYGPGQSIDKIKHPAYLMNYRFEIEWINPEAEATIFAREVRKIKNADMRNIFRLFFNWEIGSAFKNSVQNWERLVDLHMKFLKLKLRKENLAMFYPGMSGDELKVLHNIFDRTAVATSDLRNQIQVTLVGSDDVAVTYAVFVRFFREGILFLYVPTTLPLEGIHRLLSDRGRVIRDLLKKRLPTVVPFCVLVADLQDSLRICAELPVEEYFELINQIWEVMEVSLTKFGGIYGKHAGDGAVYYFLKERDSNYMINVILCALEMKEKTEKLSAEWKIRKKWHNDLFLNIGINEGQEYFSTTYISRSIEFMALGDTINYASRLSDLARNGAILATKELYNKLDDDERGQFLFGIKRKVYDKEVFVENTFSRVTDLINGDDLTRRSFTDIATLAVTEIVGKNVRTADDDGDDSEPVL